MACKRATAATAALIFSASLVSAQDTTGQISLELNRAAASSENGCQVVFFVQNGLEDALEDVTWRLAVFGADGVFRNLLALPMGSLSPGKRRIVQYNLPSPCSELSEIIVNDVAQCQIAGDSGDSSDVCLSSLNVSSRADIAFGL